MDTEWFWALTLFGMLACFFSDGAKKPLPPLLRRRP